MEKIILASGSPRRRELLAMAGIPYEAAPADVDEMCSLPADQAVVELSRRKALACAKDHPGQIILGADTLVCLDGRSLGKPHSAEEAASMLRSLRGRTHDVYTGVTIIAADGILHSGLSASRVTFAADITEDEIRRYAASGEPMDKAGAYAIQGGAGLWITRVEGSYSGVIGLPLDMVRAFLTACGAGDLFFSAH